MLKITVTETPTERRSVLEGRLTRPWVTAVRVHWRRTRHARQGRTCVADLNDVTGIEKIRAGEVQQMMPLPLPCTLGGDFSGVVEAVGADVVGFTVGTEVYGQAGSSRRWAVGPGGCSPP